MANQWGYDEKFMQEQNHPLWRNDRMRPSTATLGAKGCFIDCARYGASRLFNKLIPIKETNQKMGATPGGYTANGDASWDAIRKVLGIKISATRPTGVPVVTMRNVWVRGINNAMFSHWVVELSGGLMMDPLKAGGNFVHKIDFYPPVFIKAGVINRRYISKA